MFRSIPWIQASLISIGISLCAQAQDTLSPVITFAHGAQINDIAYNQQGNCVATVGQNFRGKFWNVDRSVNFSAPESRDSIATVRHNARIGQIIFSENYAATASDDDIAKLWAQTSILVNALGVPALALKAIANSRNGQDATRVAIDSTEKFMAMGTAKGEAQLLDLTDIKVRSRVPDANYGQYEADYVYEAEPDNPNFNNIETGIEEPALIARMWHKGSIADIVFSPKDKWVATLSEDMTAKVWNYDKNPEPSDNGRLVLVLEVLIDLDGSVALNRNQLFFSPDGNFLGVSHGTKVSIYNLRKISKNSKGTPIAALYAEVEFEHAIHVIEFDHEWTKLGIGINNGTDCQFIVWNLAGLTPNAQGVVTPEKVAQKDFEDDQINDIRFDRFGELMVTAMQSQNASLFNVTGLDSAGNALNTSEPDLLANLPHINTSVSKIRFSPDNQKLVTAANDGNARLWDVTDYAEANTSSANMIASGVTLVTTIALFITSLFY